MNSDFHRIVHLDLKGAPWSVEYLSKVIMVAKKWGATGILFEWEDTFPFVGELTCVGSLGGSSREGMYTQSEVQHLLQFVKDNELIPIQLIQTIGHLEYVLKHGQYIHLRELSRSPAVLCPTRSGSKTLVENLVTQILEAQPDASYIHIGADEAWHMNICDDCRSKSASHKHGSAGLYLDHIASIAAFVKSKRSDITVLIWDDMLRNVEEGVLKAHNLGELVQPVVWNYSPVGAFSLDIHMWARYSHVFTKMWAGSAFKGANGSCQITSPVSRYVSNQEAWIEELKVYEGEISFAGVILTGWSRYDHYATLCELLPVSLPSLASCIKMWTRTEEVPKEAVISEVLPSSEWAGEELARALHTFVALRESTQQFLNGELIMTWLNPWQLEHEYTSPLQAEAIANAANHHLSSLTSIQETLTRQLSIAGARSAAEWRATWLQPLAARLRGVVRDATDRAAPAASVTPKSDKRRTCD